MHVPFLDFLLPQRSLLGAEGFLITDAERRMLQRCAPVILERPALRAMGLRFLDRVFAGARYAESDLLREAIHRFKYGNARTLKAELGMFLVRTAPRMDLLPKPILCPIPLHWTRRLDRGFNQAELLASVLAAHRGWRMEHLLRRIRPTGHQAWRKHEKRGEAVKGAFRYADWTVFRWLVSRCSFQTPDRVTSQRATSTVPPFVILIDDLMTTGATLNACAKVLKRAGVRRVEGWVVALG